jgi:cytochrome c peroxidase
LRNRTSGRRSLRCLRRETVAGLIFLAALSLAIGTAVSSVQVPNDGAGPPDGPPRRNGGGPGGGRPGGQGGLNPVELLGRTVFFDRNLSNPPGIACGSCHLPEAGFTYFDSAVNQKYGVVPGATPGRFGNRKPMTISYAWFVPEGPTAWRRRQQAWEGGFFADGRASTLEAQAREPMVNPNEMDNTAHGLASPDLVVRKVLGGSYTNLLTQAYGDDATARPTATVFLLLRQAIAAYEKSRDVSPFSSKYDAVAQGQAQFTPAELNGLRLFTGSVTGRPGGAANAKSAQCITCHTISDSADRGRDFFTNWTFANIGVPRNPRNPYYKQTRVAADPQGFNPDGDKYVDLGLGGVLYPERQLPGGNLGPAGNGRGDFLEANGTFRVPSLRNVDKRPSPTFVKCYMHNGVFRSLKEVVHFYNTRNLTTRGEVIALTSPTPYAGLKGKPVWPMPEVASATTLQNPDGRPNSPRARVGNLGLTPGEEDDIVAFLGTLSDGYFTPARRRPPGN